MPHVADVASAQCPAGAGKLQRAGRQGRRGRSQGSCFGGRTRRRALQLHIAARAVEDDPRNCTRFLVLGKEACAKANNVLHKTSLIFSVPNRAGALLDALAPFAKYRVSMVRLESRPARNGAWDYNFYVDVDGHVEDEDLGKAIAELEQIALYLKILGSYTAAY